MTQEAGSTIVSGEIGVAAEHQGVVNGPKKIERKRQFPVAPFVAEVTNYFEKAENEKLVTPIGVIRYGDGEAVYIAESQAGHVKISYADISNAADLRGFSGSQDRVLDLSQLADVHIATIQVNATRIFEEGAALGNKTIKCRLSYQYEGEKRTEYLLEADLLDLFTGRKGGFILFSGGNLPEETGFVFEKIVDKKNVGVVFLSHADDNKETDSTSAGGLTLLLRSINDQWEKAILDRVSSDYLARFRKATLSTNSALARELLRSMIIAHLRDARVDGHADSMFFVKQLFPDKGGFARAADNIDVLSVIDRILIEDKKPNVEEAPQVEAVVDSFFSREQHYISTLQALVTREAKVLRQTYEPDFGKNLKVTATYINQLLNWVSRGDLDNSDIDKVKDAVFLLEELRSNDQLTYQWTHIHLKENDDGKSVKLEIRWNRNDYPNGYDGFTREFLAKFLDRTIDEAKVRYMLLKNRVDDNVVSPDEAEDSNTSVDPEGFESPTASA